MKPCLTNPDLQMMWRESLGVFVASRGLHSLKKIKVDSSLSNDEYEVAVAILSSL